MSLSCSSLLSRSASACFLELGDIVTAEQMKDLFGTGCDPVSGRPLGSAYKI
jgi:hypothetical protein